ncbi:MAG: STAS domain-containing protein [Phycisphaerales bacterium]|nr:STAS domain-containing protein [Phycisphaerales bacterium]
MSTKITKYDNVAVLIVKDDLVGEEVEVFCGQSDQCVADGFFNIVVDCTAVGVFDSMGLEALLDLQNKCEDEFGNVKLCGLDETLTRILEITRLMRRFEVFDDVDAAVGNFS